MKRHLVGRKDIFAIGRAVENLATAIKSGDLEAVAVTQRALTERLDAELTLRQKMPNK